jgi:hypothetical protein
MNALNITEFQYWVMSDISKRQMKVGDAWFPWQTLRALMKRGMVAWNEDRTVKLTPSGHLVLSTIRIIDELNNQGGAQ